MATTTFSDAFEKFISLRVGYVTDSTVKRVYVPTRNSVTRILTDRQLEDYTPLILIDYVQNLLAKHKPGGVNVKIRCLRSFGSWLERTQVYPENSFKSMELVRARGRLPRFLSREEFLAIMRAEQNENRREIYLTLVLTGLRACDVLSLRGRDLDTARWLIRITMQKTGREVLVPVHRMLQGIVQKRLRGPEDLLFPSLRTVGALSHAFQRAAKAARVERVKLHDLRRTAGAWLVAAGASIFVVQRILGHTSPTITANLYASIQPQQLISDVNAIPMLQLEEAPSHSDV